MRTRAVVTRAATLCAIALAVAAAWLPARAQAQSDVARIADYPLVGDEGQRVPNHKVRLLGPIDQLPGVVVVGNRAGNKTLTEFYDLNCPYCRVAAADIADMIEHDPQLRLVLVPYPVLGVASITASRVELAVAKLGTPEEFYAFQRQIFAQRGTADGQRALKVAHGLGLDEVALTTLGNSDEITRTMKNLVNLGTALGLEATPSFIAGGVAILGYPGRHALQAIADAVGACGKVVC
jgi:protein-disulfide isomerase